MSRNDTGMRGIAPLFRLFLFQKGENERVHTVGGAHRGVLDVEEGLEVTRHGCRGLMELTKRQEGRIEGRGSRRERREEGTKWGRC